MSDSEELKKLKEKRSREGLLLSEELDFIKLKKRLEEL